MDATLAARGLPPAQMPPAAAHELALWRRLRSSGDGEARAGLLALHMPYARIVAATYYARRYTDEVEFGDYLQYASIGLLEALERFDPDRGALFRTFAARRMHGAILNGLERLSEKQQQISARQRLRAERVQAAKEMARDAGTGDRLYAYVAEVGVGLALAWLLEGTGLVHPGERAESLPFYHHAEVRQLRESLLQAVEALPAQERTVIRSHYLQDLPFEEIATMLQLTKGRISQVHKSALQRLRACLGDGAAVAL
ncbi:sigma-70 family RNA polymerase sigma factor [Ramlibacter agri]|nr:sigma-70 family RNA polymerase sigma factor [Ramlibacter agri]